MSIGPPSGGLAAPAVQLRVAGPFDMPLLAALHARCFAEVWDAAAWAGLLAMPGAVAFLAEDPGTGDALGFVALRAVAGEAEIISIGVRPGARRAGIGRRLLAAAIAAVAEGGAARLFLEVAADNWPARALYLASGFVEVGRRPDYYRRGAGAVTALVLARDTAPPPG